MTSRQLHQSDNPWRINKIDANYTREEVENNNLLKNVRSIFNKVTPTTKEYMIHRFQELYIYESPVLDKILSLIFKKAVQEPLFCPLYVDMCNQVVRNELIATRSTKVRNALLILAQEHFVSKSSDEFVIKMRADIDAELYPRIKREKQIEMQESQSNYKRRRLGHIRWLGHLYLQNLISVRIITFCVVDLLKTVTTRSLLDGFHPDNEAIECAVKLLEVIGKRLDEEANAAAAAETKPSRLSPPPFPLELTFATLNGAMPLVSCRIRFLIMDLFELRAREWVHRRAEELPRTLDEIKEEIKKEKRNADAARTTAAKPSVQDKAAKGSTASAEGEAEKMTTQAAKAAAPQASQKLIDTSISTDSFDELTDDCSCHICCEPYDSVKIIPRSLDCGHAFCEVCIYNDTMKINMIVNCPICQKATQVPEGRVLPIIYQLIGIAEKLMKAKIEPKMSCKACEKKCTPASVRICDKDKCEMYNQLLCLTCALDRGHGGHVVKYDLRIAKIRKELRAEVENHCSRVKDKKDVVLQKAREVAKIAASLEKSLSDSTIPEQVIRQIDTIVTEQDAEELRLIVIDLATNLFNDCNALEEALNHTINETKQHCEATDNKNPNENAD